jgi:hypothetical protein
LLILQDLYGFFILLDLESFYTGIGLQNQWGKKREGWFWRNAGFFVPFSVRAMTTSDTRT